MQRLINIQNKLNAPKNQRNNFGGYNYRSAEDILEALKPLLKEEKCAVVLKDDIILVGTGEMSRFYVKAIATLFDETGKEIANSVAFARESLNKKGQDDSQITGTASSYARKYALNGLFCIDDNKDADTDEYHNEVENTPKSSVEDIVNGINEKMTLDNWKGFYAKAMGLYGKDTPEYKVWIKAFSDKKRTLEDASAKNELQSEADFINNIGENTEGDITEDYYD